MKQNLLLFYEYIDSAYWVNHVLSAGVFLHSQFFFQKQVFHEYHQSASSKDPALVGPDMGPNCLKRLSADDTSS